MQARTEKASIVTNLDELSGHNSELHAGRDYILMDCGIRQTAHEHGKIPVPDASRLVPHCVRVGPQLRPHNCLPVTLSLANES